MKNALPIFAVLSAFLLLICGCAEGGTKMLNTKSNDNMAVTSTNFAAGGAIPEKYTCNGEDISPNLKWSNFPEETEAFALRVIDVDAPRGFFAHWRVANIPVDKNELAEGEKGAGIELENDFGEIGYGGPCPPPIPHRYYFTIYALDSELKDVARKNFGTLIEQHAIASGTIIGIYPPQ